MKKALLITLFCSLSFNGYSQPGGKSPMPNMEVKLFAYQVLLYVYHFKYDTLFNDQRKAAKLFTGPGWQGFQSAVTSSKLITMVKKHKYQVEAVPLSPPKITKQGVVKSEYLWQVDLPAMVVYKNPSYQQVQYLNVSILVTYMNKKLKVKQFVTTKGKPINCAKTSEKIKLTEEKPTAKEEPTTKK